MKAKAKTTKTIAARGAVRGVEETRLFTIVLTEQEVSAVVDAMSYWDLAEGGNNYEQGYESPDYEEAEASAKAARRVMRQLHEALS